MPSKVTIALAPGDGIGPEIMDACLRIFAEAGVNEHADFTTVEMGQSVFAAGESRGMTDDAVDAIERCGILYKGPMGTPIGGGGKSINVTLRKTFGAFANLRHFQSLPGVDTVFSRAGVPVEMYIVRENVEDTYGGVEHRVTNDAVECKRLISAPGCDQVHEFAFKTAKRLGIDKVHCGHKANIMKMTDGLFLSRFRTVGADYPDIELDDVIIDALCMNLVLKPQVYKMIVLPNLQGDIVSDLAAGLVGGLGFAPSANIGDQISIFEAVHGTAPDIAGKGLANPTSLLLSGIMMLRHVGLLQCAAVIENALLSTLESGVHTGDFGDPSIPPVGTSAFADAVIGRLGKTPSGQEARAVPEVNEVTFSPPTRPSVNRMMQTFTQAVANVVGCDITIETTLTPLDLAHRLERLADGTPYKLTTISNRGTQVWPSGSPYTELVDAQSVRFEIEDKHLIGRVGQGPTVHLLSRIAEKFAIVGFLPLREYDGERGFSLAQGQ